MAYNTWKRDDFYAVSYSDKPCLEELIFLFIFSLLVFYFFCYKGVGEEDQSIFQVLLRDIKAMKTV